jgi:hypothetical protein
MARIKWNSPAGVAIIAGSFTVLAALIGFLGDIIPRPDGENGSDSSPVPDSEKLQFSGSRSNSGSLFDPEGEPTLFNAETTKHDDLLWIGERSDGVPSAGFLEIPLNDPALFSGRSSLDQAVLSITSFRVTGDPFGNLGPLLLFLDECGDLDVGDGKDLFSSGIRLRTFVSQDELDQPIDLTQEVRRVLGSAGRSLQFKFVPAGRPPTDEFKDRLSMRPEDVRLTVRFHRMP